MLYKGSSKLVFICIEANEDVFRIEDNEEAETASSSNASLYFWYIRCSVMYSENVTQ